jgi:hypothetical protein
MIHITIDWPEVLAFFVGLIALKLAKHWIARKGQTI